MACCMITSMAEKTWTPDGYALLALQQRESEKITCEYCAISGLWTMGNAINVKICMMVLLIELYLFFPLSVTVTIFQGHSSVKQL